MVLFGNATLVTGASTVTTLLIPGAKDGICTVTLLDDTSPIEARPLPVSLTVVPITVACPGRVRRGDIEHTDRRRVVAGDDAERLADAYRRQVGSVAAVVGRVGVGAHRQRLRRRLDGRPERFWSVVAPLQLPLPAASK